jgi:uncharacterized repeat protein (TIGR02543 family)
MNVLCSAVNHRFAIAGIVCTFFLPPAVHALNPIQQENAKLGTSAWQLSNPAITCIDPSCFSNPTDGVSEHEMEGYASLTSVNRGGQISLFVRTADPQYTIEIYRMGWYGGAGARQVMSAVTRNRTAQPNATVDTTTGLVECNWVDPFVLTIPNNAADPTDWCSGVYVAKLTGTISGKQSYIIFVVRDDARSSDYLFQSSITTAQAYNRYGGESLYRNYAGLSPGTHANKVSFNRPYIGDGGASLGSNGNGNPGYDYGAAFFFIFNEYNMVRFMEREGYDVTYCTDVDTHENVNLLLSRRAFLSIGHDEYWSWQMRANVEAARDQGVSLGFFCANSCYWQIRFEASPVTGDPNRTIVCYKNETSANVDPLSLSGSRFSTVRWRDDPVNRPEDALLGVMFPGSTVESDIVIYDSSHWVCAGTGLQNGDHLVRLAGYEADRSFGNAPSNLRLIAHSIVDFGTTIDYTDMTVYQAACGANVFATGSIQWSWGLDDYLADPAGSVFRTTRLDSRAQQMTRNVLNRFRTSLSVNASGIGSGTVLRYPDLHYCTNGSTVALAAVPSCGYVFTGWSGDTNGTQNPLALVLTTNLSLTANFAALPCACLPSGLVSWWPAEGDASDAQGNNPGTLQNGPMFGVGEVGQAFSFDGINAAVVVPSSPSLNFGAGDSFTIEAWVRIDGISTLGEDALLHKWVSGVGGYTWELIGPAANPHLEFTVSTGVFGVTGLAVPPTDGNFHHLAVTLDRGAGTLKSYVDGVLQHSTSISGMGSLANNSRLWIGHQTLDSSTSAKPFHGVIDELSVYSRALSASEIQAIYNVGSAGKCLPVCTPAPSGSIAWWTGSSNANDIISDNNGTLQNGTTFAPGKLGTAFSFDGVDDYVLVPDSSSLDVSSGLTIEAWLKTSGTADYARIVSKYYYNPGTPGNNNGYGFGFDTGGTMRCDIGDGSGSYAYALNSTVVADGRWHHAAVVFSPSQATVYVDGVAGTPVTLNGFAPNTTEPLYLGQDPAAAGRFYTGLLDEVSIYNRALSASEVQAIYNAGSAGKCLSPVYITSVNRSGNNVNLSWLSQKGMRYRVESCSDLTSGSWATVVSLGEITATGANTSASVSDTAAQRFYRVVMLQ